MHDSTSFQQLFIWLKHSKYNCDLCVNLFVEVLHLHQCIGTSKLIQPGPTARVSSSNEVRSHYVVIGSRHYIEVLERIDWMRDSLRACSSKNHAHLDWNVQITSPHDRVVFLSFWTQLLKHSCWWNHFLIKPQFNRHRAAGVIQNWWPPTQSLKVINFNGIEHSPSESYPDSAQKTSSKTMTMIQICLWLSQSVQHSPRRFQNHVARCGSCAKMFEKAEHALTLQICSNVILY